MAQQYQEMYQEFPSNRSPGTSRYHGLNNSLNRQPSRHFEGYAGPLQQSHYAQEDHSGGRFEGVPRFDRIPSSSLPHPNAYSYDNQTWNYGAGNMNGGGMNGISGISNMGGTGRVKSASRRAGLPQTWLDSSQMQPPPMPNVGMHHQMNGHPLNGQYAPSHMQPHHPRISPPPDHDELIPTAIVIKNIPFAVKKESLVALMTEMNLPLPYAFNYHFDAGVFRGLAFANFTTPEETSAVIDAMNHMDLQGRKLRVEYKKMLPAAERERIERDKREKRGQLEEQHRPLGSATAPPLHSQTSMNSLHSNHIPASPSPVQLRSKGSDYATFSPNPSTTSASLADVDMNDPATLGYFSELTLFKNDSNREILVFPSTVSPEDRKVVHVLSHHMGLEHKSEGAGDSRYVQIFKTRQNTTSTTVATLPQNYYNTERRGLNRAATIDFAVARENESGYYQHTLGRQSSGLLDIPASPGLGLNAAHNLRAAKSFADLRSYTPSPAQSVASYSNNPSQNIARYADYGHSSAASGTPNLTPTSAGGQMNGRDDAFLVNGLNNMTIGFDRPPGRTNGRIGQERESHAINAGPIGSHRPVNGNNYEENPRNGASAVPERQPRGPASEWGSGFSRPRQNGHRNQGSGELDLNSIERDWDGNGAQDSSDRNTNGRYH
ncbi:putative RNA-binding post-transcriptional regulator cip2 [Amylocarpus encephaloides]|uniref:RNA-binding post-transcriptional regulator cip2 n=1 Tax=Amylocarpus encephaloides TaxID=45428 RepID=A0A9P7YA25_9HELO|nr:putative RNA-binding post-transcriptional regulator cip2 [Amylocarpus encephaloides]